MLGFDAAGVVLFHMRGRKRINLGDNGDAEMQAAVRAAMLAQAGLTAAEDVFALGGGLDDQLGGVMAGLMQAQLAEAQVELDLRDRIAHHTVIFASRYRELLDDIFTGSTLPDDFSLYVHAPTVTDPSLAPDGCDAFYVLSPVPHLDSPTDWSTAAKR